MRIKRIMLQNIRSYDLAEIEFPEGALLLSGDIGSGKSSVLLAIEFALFGLQKGTGGNILLRNGKDIGGVKLDLEIDSKEVKIERRIKRVKDNAKQDLCFLEVDGKKEQLSSTELKSRVLTLLNYPQELLTKNPVLYRYTVYTPQEEMKSILTEDASLRLNTLRRVFGIDKYKRVVENSKIISARLREQIKEKEGRVSDLEDRKSELKDKKSYQEKAKNELFSLKSKLSEAEKNAESKKLNLSDIEIKIKELNKLKTELASVSSELRIKQEQQTENKTEVLRIREKISLTERRLGDIAAITQSAENASKEIKQKESELNDIDKNYIEINKLFAGDETTRQRLQKITDSVISLEKCPTCKQKVGHEHKHSIKNEADKEMAAIDLNLLKIKKEKAELEAKRKDAIQNINLLRQKERDALSAKGEIKSLEENKQTLKRLETSSEIISGKVTELLGKKYSLDMKMKSFNDLEDKYIILRRGLDKADEEKRMIEISKAKVERHAEDLEIFSARLEKEIADKEKIRASISKIKKMKDWIALDFEAVMEEIERAVMVKVHSEFSGLFGKWFSILADGLGARINEDFTPVIEQQGYEIDYGHLSGGERTAGALAYRLSLNQVINSMISDIKTKDLLILDEPTDGFSAEQLDKMRDVLNELKVAQLIIVSHEGKIESFVDKIIKLHKDEATRVIN